MLPTVLHVVIAISAGYAVGSEFRRRSMRAWWEASGHSIAAALVGKLLPYFIVQMAMFALMVGILDVWLGVGFRGDVVLMTVAAMLLIVAYQMIGCLLQLLTREHGGRPQPDGDHRLACLRLCGRRDSRSWPWDVSSRMGRDPAVALVYPDPVRPGRARGAAAPDRGTVRVPLRHHRHPGGWCGCASARWPDRAMPRRRARGADPPGVRRRGRLRRGVAPRARRPRRVLGLFILAPVLYAFFYPQPYLGQLVRNIPIAVVDQDNTELAAA